MRRILPQAFRDSAEKRRDFLLLCASAVKIITSNLIYFTFIGAAEL